MTSYQNTELGSRKSVFAPLESAYWDEQIDAFIETPMDRHFEGEQVNERYYDLEDNYTSADSYCV